MFNLHLVHINVPAGKSVKLIPFGDLHRDVACCDKTRYINFLKRCRHDDDSQTYYLLMGDPNDFASTSEREILSNRKLHESTAKKLDAMADADTNAFIKEIIFMKGKMIGVATGNHRWVYEDGSNSDEHIAEALATKYLGELSYIRLSLDQCGRRIPVDIVAHHGKAGGKCAGTTINQVDDLRRIFPIADIYLMGHDHKRGVWPESTLIVASNIRNGGALEVKQKRQLLCRTGSFLRGYVDGEQSYVADKLLRPCELGTIKLDIRLKRSRSKLEETDCTMADIHAYV